jgi:hypothetical protein
MWIALFAGCAPQPRFVEPPGPLTVPSLTGCTYVQEAQGRTLTWKYGSSGHLLSDSIEDDDGSWHATYVWKGDCLKQMIRSTEGQPVASYYGSGLAYWGEEVNVFTCDSHGNWESWERRAMSPGGDASSDRVYRYSNEYDSNDQLARVEIRVEQSSPWLAEDEEVGAGGVLEDASFLWYDETRTLEAVFQDVSEGGSNTATWIWDHDRLLGWDMRGSGSERTMTRVWEKDQLTDESYTEEEAEIAWLEYGYDSMTDRFPSDLWVGGSTWPSHPGLPRPPDVAEFIGGLVASSTIEVECL